MYSREKEAVFFSFLFPILLLALFSVIFGSQFDGGDTNGMTAGGYFLPGMLSAGVLLTSFQTMAMSVADRARRRHAQAAARPPRCPRSPTSSARSAWSRRPRRRRSALLLCRGAVFFGVQLPTTADRWAVFALVFALGVFGGTVLGIAYSSMATSRTVGAVVIGPMLVLQFISGVYIAFDDVPTVAAAGRRRYSRSSGSPRACARSSSPPTWRRPRWPGPGRPAARALVLLAWARGRAGAVRAHLQVVQARHHVSRGTHDERRDGDGSDLARGVRGHVAAAAALLARRVRHRVGAPPSS